MPAARESDDEIDDEEYEVDDEESETIACPECGADVYEDAEQCPACGSYFVRSTNPWRDRPKWWIVLGLLGILAVIAILVRF